MLFRQKAEKTRQFIVKIAKELIREKTVNYHVKDYPDKGPDGMESPGQESKAANVLIPYFEKIGVSYRIYEKIHGRANLMACLGSKLPGYRRLLVLLHTDVAPSGGADMWDSDPFTPYEKDGFLYGRGAADNKGQLAAAMSAFILLHEARAQIKGEFLLGVLADEEVQVEKAGFEVVDEALDFGSFITDAIVPDTAGNNMAIERAEKGRVIVKVIVHGKQAHGSTPSKGVNAIYGFSEFALLMEKRSLQHTFHPVLETPTVNLGIVKGGNAPNNVAACCEGVFDIRTVPGMTVQGVLDEMIQLSIQVQRNDIRFEFELISSSEPTVVPEDAYIIQAIKKCVPQAVTVGIGGGTFCKQLIALGVNAVGWSPGSCNAAHQANENISIDELVEFAGMLAEVAYDVCNQKVA
jgi:acetylornithine deacetylase/succinyl-diaminopimelate desuccinylase-like protein